MRAAAAERISRELVSTRDVTLSGRCQARGGRNGGLPVCDERALASKEAAIFIKVEGNTMIEDVPTKPKHFTAQVAMLAQWSMPFSHGLALWGQQSGMSSVMEIPAASSDFTLTPALAAAGSIATERAIRNATMVRVMFIAWTSMN
jgi:hypothetical protein